MNLDNIKLPPVSNKLFDKIQAAFPPMHPLDVDESTTMIDVHRNAAQQEVIEYIKKYLTKDTEYTPVSFLEKLKHILIRGD